VSAEEGDLVGDLRGESREPQLGLDVEAVARLDLERRRPLGPALSDERPEPLFTRALKLTGAVPGKISRSSDALLFASMITSRTSEDWNVASCAAWAGLARRTQARRG